MSNAIRHPIPAHFIGLTLAALCACACLSAKGPSAESFTAQGLTARHKSYLRNLKYYLEQVEGNLGRLGRHDAKTRAGVLQNTERVLGRAGKALAKLPAGSRKVEAFRARFEAAKRRLSASAKQGAKPRDASASSAVASTPAQLESAREAMAKLLQVIGRGTSVLGEPARFTLLGKRWKSIEQQVAEVGRRHALAMRESSGPGWELSRLHRDAQGRIDRIERAVRNACKTQEKQLAARLDRMSEFVVNAVAKKNHRVFGQYVRNETRAQREIHALLDAWGYDTSSARAKLAVTSARMAKLEASLADRIVAHNRAPADHYRGKDRAALTAKVRAAWQAKHPQDEILSVRFPDGSWRRDRRLRYSDVGGFWREDCSSMQVRILVVHDAKLALNCGVTLEKRHDANPLTVRVLLQPKRVESPSFRILRSKL